MFDMRIKIMRIYIGEVREKNMMIKYMNIITYVREEKQQKEVGK